MKWCVIGAGGIADRRAIPALMKIGGELTGVFDKIPETAERIGKKYSVPFFTDAREMFERVDCDAVYIATPVFIHKEHALLALSFGKHILIEKPISLRYADGKEIVDAFKREGKSVAVGYMMKYHNLHVKARELVQSGGIGNVGSIGIRFSCWYPDIANAWRQKRELGGGGALMDLGVHCMELAEYILNEEIKNVKAFCSTRTFSYDVEDGAVVAFETQSGVLGHIAVNFNVPDAASESRLEIYGTGGSIVCSGTLGQEECGTLEYLYSPQGEYSAIQNRTTCKPRKYLPENGDLYAKQFIDFEKSVKVAEPDYFYAERAVHIQNIIDSVYATETDK